MVNEYSKVNAKRLIPSNQDIDNAMNALRGIVVETPLIEMPELAVELKLNSLHLKLESMQRTGSFKFRGAYWRCMQLSPEEKINGVVAFSSGNFAQALPVATSLVGTTTKIVMPSDAPPVKKTRSEGFGAEVVLTEHGNRGRELVAAKKAEQISKEENRVLLHPFDDRDMIAGNSTVAVEIVEALRMRSYPLPDNVYCCAGGGGLISGIAIAFARYSPKTRVIPVEPKGFDSTGQSLNMGKLMTLHLAKTSICDALQALRPGKVPFACLSSLNMGSPMVVIDEQVCEAMALAYELRRIILEPAGAAPLAALMKNAKLEEGKDIIVIASGSNIQPMDFIRYIE